jgi:hypothetical protein
MKALDAAPAEPKRKHFEKPQEKKQPSLEDQLSSLSSKFKVR